MRLLEQSLKLYSFSKHFSKLHYQQMLGRMILAFLGLNMMGCGIFPKTYPPEAEVAPTPWAFCGEEQQEIERLQKLLAEKDTQQQEIERLRKLLADKEAYIRSQEARQQDQAKTLQETSSQAAQAQVKLRRLATRPAAASTIAEVEMVMENLKSSPIAGSAEVLQIQAQRLLNAAGASYGEDNYGAALDYAVQAREFINMIMNNYDRKASDTHNVTISFRVPIALRATANSNLRQKPGLKAVVLALLKKESPMIAEAYRGDWLLISADGRSGWVLNTLVEAQVGKP